MRRRRRLPWLWTYVRNVNEMERMSIFMHETRFLRNLSLIIKSNAFLCIDDVSLFFFFKQVLTWTKTKTNVSDFPYYIAILHRSVLFWIEAVSHISLLFMFCTHTNTIVSYKKTIYFMSQVLVSSDVSLERRRWLLSFKHLTLTLTFLGDIDVRCSV